MESLTNWGFISPVSPEKLNRLLIYYQDNVKAKGDKLSKRIAEKLLNLILSLTGTVEKHSILSQPLTQNARTALELLYFFVLSEDPEFYTAVERKEAVTLISALKLKKHLSDDDERHVESTRNLINLLLQKFPKFEPFLHEVLGEKKTPKSQRIKPEHLPPAGLYYDMEADEVVDLFQTDGDQGLTTSETQSRVEKYGLNKLPEPPAPSPWKMFFKQFLDFMVVILLIVGIISIGLQDYIEGAVLIIVVVSNVTIGFVQEWKAERALRALKMLTVPMAKVIRDGKTEIIESFKVLPGDIVSLEEGDAIPADLRLIETANLEVIESILTGESVPVLKSTAAIKKTNLNIGDRTNMAFMSTNVSKGRGKGVVVSTGILTEVGQITKALTKSSNRETLLKKRLSKLGKVLVIISGVLCFIIVGIGLAQTYSRKKSISTSVDLIKWIKVGISLAVSVIPEGLVAVVTVTLALGVQRMAWKHAIVRQLPAVETIGSVTTICSDKTGTLTEGKMTAVKVWSSKESRIFSISGTGLVPKGELFDETQTKVVEYDKVLREVIMVCALCNNSSIEFDKEKSDWKSIGDPTEVALEVFAQKVSVGRSKWVESKGFKFEGEIPFDSDRKRMMVIYSTTKGNGFSLVKGAPEAILSICKYYGHDKQLLTTESIAETDRVNSLMAADGLRVLGLAYKPLSAESVQSVSGLENLNEFEENLVFVGLIGIIDPPRKEVKDTIAQCKQAGIRVCMITGDHPTTAFAIGCKLGLVEPHQLSSLVNGSSLDAMSKSDLAAMDEFPTVFARVSPSNKLKIVNALQLRGEITAMTGDGVNDAPAIKNSNVGIAMGKTATDLTKDAADIILTDDNFTTIVEAVKEGRKTFDNIQKFILYLLSSNIAEIYLMLFSVIINVPVPLTPIMILWANLVADIPPALALGLDGPVSNLMTRPPRNPKSEIFNLDLLIMVLLYGASMGFITLGIYCIAMYVMHYEIVEDMEEPGHARQLAFISLTMTQIFHVFLVRSSNTAFSKDLISNKYLLAGVIFAVLCLILATYTPGFNTILNQTPLEGQDWGIIFACMTLHIVFVEIFKIFYRIIRKKLDARKKNRKRDEENQKLEQEKQEEQESKSKDLQIEPNHPLEEDRLEEKEVKEKEDAEPTPKSSKPSSPKTSRPTSPKSPTKKKHVLLEESQASETEESSMDEYVFKEDL